MESLLTQIQLNSPSTEETIAPKAKEVKNSSVSSSQEISTALLNQLFPEQKREDKTIKQARAILGGLTEKFSSSELQEIISLSQYLTESWLDMWERELFEGKTLEELLNSGQNHNAK